MGMKPSVSDDGSIQKQIGTAYDVVKSVADNLPAILAVTQAVEDAQEVIADITEQVGLATVAANNATAVVGTIENLKTQTETARNTTEGYKNTAVAAKDDAVAAQTVVVPLAADFQTKWPTFTTNYSDTINKYNSIVSMHDDVDADRIAAESARSKAELWANAAVDVPVETSKFSSMHWATKASGFNTLAQGFASTANSRANDANQSAIDAASSATTANNRATDANTSATTASNYATTALGYRNEAYNFKEEAKAYRDQAGAIVGGNFVPNTTTVNGLQLNNNIVLTAAQLTDLVPKTTTINGKALTGNVTLAVTDITGAAKTDGTNASGTWPISITSGSGKLNPVIRSKNTTSSDSSNYTKFLRVTVPLQYQEYNLLAGVLVTENSVLSAQSELLTIRVKQNTAIGTDPTVYVQSRTLTTITTGLEYGYVIVQNAPTVIVDFYIKTGNTFTQAGFSILQDRLSTGSGTVTAVWYDNDPFVTIPVGYVAGTRTHLVHVTTVDNKVPWANLNIATSISNLQTLLENGSLGYLRKTAASTYVVETSIPLTSTTGTLAVNRGGTGVITLNGLVKGNGTSAFSAAIAGTDYVIPSGSITGNAATATKLATPVTINGINFDGSANITIPAPGSVATADALTTARTITATGDADWSVTFKGDTNVTAALTLKNVATAGTGIKVTYNAKGLITGSTGLVAADIPNLDWSKITSGVPSFALQSDSRFTDSREWTATTATLVDITGANTTRKAFTGAVIKSAIDDIAAPKTSTNDRLTALENAPDSALIAKRALAIAIMGL